MPQSIRKRRHPDEKGAPQNVVRRPKSEQKAEYSLVPYTSFSEQAMSLNQNAALIQIYILLTRFPSISFVKIDVLVPDPKTFITPENHFHLLEPTRPSCSVLLFFSFELPTKPPVNPHLPPPTRPSGGHPRRSEQGTETGAELVL